MIMLVVLLLLGLAILGYGARVNDQYPVSGGAGGTTTGTALLARNPQTFTGVNNFTNTTASTSTSTGALVVSGGVGVGGNLYAAGNIRTSGVISAVNTIEVDATAGNNAFLNINAAAGEQAIINMGVNGLYHGQILSTQAAPFILSDGGVLANVLVYYTGTGSSGYWAFGNTTASTAYNNGAVVIAGGVGIAGALNVAGVISSNAPFAIATGGNTACTITAPTGDDGTLFLNGGVGGDGVLAFGTSSTTGLEIYGDHTAQLVFYDTINNRSVFQYAPGSVSVGYLFMPSTTASTSTTTGALVISGGVGMAGNLNVAGPIAGNSTLTAFNTITLNATTGTAAILEINAPTGQNPFILLGINGTYHGNISSSATNPIIFNDYGVLSNTLYYTTGSGSTGFWTFGTTTPSTSTTTGALVVSGGVGIAGAAYIAGALNVGGITNVTNTTASTSITTGAITCAGGHGISGALFVGGACTLGGNSAPAANTFLGHNIWGGTSGGLPTTGALGELVSSGQVVSNFPGSGGTGAMASITLTAGRWLISAVGILSSGTTGFTAGSIVYLSAAQSTSPVGTAGVNQVQMETPSLVANNIFTLSVHNWPQFTNATTTFVVAVQGTYVGGTPTFTGSINAIRIG
jgi:hypothetical protein